MKALSFVFSFILALTMFFGGYPDFEDRHASANPEQPEITQTGKVNPELRFRVTVKQSLQRKTALPDTLTEELYPSFANPEELVSELVYVYMEEPPTESQLEELKSLGITAYPETWIPPVGQHPQGFFLTETPVNQLEQLVLKQYVERLDTAERQVFPQNDIARDFMNTYPVWNDGYDGSGVKVAVIDSSLDYNYLDSNDRHPDIPAAAIVKDYSAYPTLDDDVRGLISGHGTHVSASALGRGIGDETYKGTAPGADLVFLKIGNDTTSGASVAAMVAAIGAAVDVYDADIINISYGSWSTFHDGSDAKCQAVDYAVSQGVTVFTAAGNEADNDLHISGTLDAENFLEFHSFYVYEEFPLSFSLVWHDPDGTPMDMGFYIQYNDVDGTYLDEETIYRAGGTSPHGTQAQTIETYSDGYWAVGPGWYNFLVINYTGVPQEFHIYSNSSSFPYYFENADPNYTLISPAEADSAIAVGAYVSRYSWTDSGGVLHNYGDWLASNIVASFSSRGPRVDHAGGTPQIPSFVAPGAGIISARDGLAEDVNNPAGSANWIDTTGNYFLMQGTSMASPLAAGVGALLQQKNPSWTPAQIRHAMETTALSGVLIGTRNDHGWGLLKAGNAGGVTLPAWLSYADAAGTVPKPGFTVPGDSAVYMQGSGFLPDSQYGVAFYDSAGNLAGSQLATTTQAGVLSTSYPFTGDEALGTWNTIVFQNFSKGTGETWINPPDTLTADWPYLITSGTFTISGPAEVVSISALAGVHAPVAGGIPVAAITPTSQFTGVMTWSPEDTPFLPSTVYTATINLAVEPGYTFEGVTENFFTVAGATATNPVDSGVVTAVFPATGSNLGTITGRVTDNKTGSPVPDAVVEVFEYDTNQFMARTTSDINGTYTLEVSSGDYKVTASKLTYRLQCYDNKDFTNADRVTVIVSEETGGIDFSLLPIGTISGRVTDGDDNPLADITIQFFDYDTDALVDSSSSNGSGNYQLIVPAGSYRVFAAPQAGGDNYIGEYYNNTIVFDEATPVTVTRGGEQTGIDFTLEPGIIYITGETRGAGGEILAGAAVTIDGVATVTSDVQGIYRIPVTAPGTYTVTASKAGYQDIPLDVTVTDLNEDVTQHFRGNTGLVPDAPNLSYVLACINRWQFAPTDGTGLDLSKVLKVINAWKNP